jgi:hypothetical protein
MLDTPSHAPYASTVAVETRSALVHLQETMGVKSTCKPNTGINAAI